MNNTTKSFDILAISVSNLHDPNFLYQSKKKSSYLVQFLNISAKSFFRVKKISKFIITLVSYK